MGASKTRHWTGKDGRRGGGEGGGGGGERGAGHGRVLSILIVIFIVDCLRIFLKESQHDIARPA